MVGCESVSPFYFDFIDTFWILPLSNWNAKKWWHFRKRSCSTQCRNWCGGRTNKEKPQLNQEQIDLYATKYKEIIKKLSIEEHRVERKCAAIKRIEIFAINNKKMNKTFEEFSAKLWNLLLDKAIVQQDSAIRFVYYSGVENTVQIKKWS